jgi:hypothetical protein
MDSGAWIGIKIAALLRGLEGQHSRWITRVFGLSRMGLSRSTRQHRKRLGLSGLVAPFWVVEVLSEQARVIARAF